MPSKETVILAARRAAAKYGIDPDVFVRQIGAESSFSAGAVSNKGAQGVAQFIPSTAKAYGVNLHDGKISDDLDGAARYMRDNLKAAGGDYKKALSLYNSGRQDGYLNIAETANYVKKILHGVTPKASTKGDTSSVTVTAPQIKDATHSEFDQKGYDRANKLSFLGQYLSKHNPNNALLTTGAIPTTAPNEADFTKTVTATEVVPGKVTRTGSSAAPSGPSKGLGGRKSGNLLELFYDPLGGIKKGAEIGAIGGHTDHVHVASGPKQTVALGKLAQKEGLHVGENPAFGGVHPVHVNGSYHYKKEAIDVSGTPAQMANYYKQVKKIYGIK